MKSASAVGAKISDDRSSERTSIAFSPSVLSTGSEFFQPEPAGYAGSAANGLNSFCQVVVHIVPFEFFCEGGDRGRGVDQQALQAGDVSEIL